MRVISICLGAVIIVKTFLNFGPLAIIDKYGLGIYWNAFLIGIVEAVSVISCYGFVEKVPRKKIFMGTLAAGVLFFSILIFLKHD